MAELNAPPPVFRPPPPAGWQLVQDQNGEVYYYNAATGATSWDVPATDRLPPGWRAVDADGAAYYFNTVTGVTQWEVPTTSARGAARATRVPQLDTQLALEAVLLGAEDKLVVVHYAQSSGFARVSASLDAAPPLLSGRAVFTETSERALRLSAAAGDDEFEDEFEDLAYSHAGVLFFRIDLQATPTPFARCRTSASCATLLTLAALHSSVSWPAHCSHTPGLACSLDAPSRTTDRAAEPLQLRAERERRADGVPLLRARRTDRRGRLAPRAPPHSRHPLAAAAAAAATEAAGLSAARGGA